MDSTEICMSVEIRVLSSCLLYSDLCTDINQTPAGCKKESISLKKAASPWQPSPKLFCFTNISPISPIMKRCSKINRHSILQTRVRYRFQGRREKEKKKKSTASLLKAQEDWKITSLPQQVTVLSLFRVSSTGESW